MREDLRWSLLARIAGTDMVLVQAITILLTALLIAPGFSFYFDLTPKLVALVVGTAAALALWAWAHVRKGGVPLPRSLAFRLFAVFLFLNVLSVAVSTWSSSNPGLSLFGTNWRRYGMVAQIAIAFFAWLLSVSCAGRLANVLIVLRAVAVAGILSSVYGVMQYLGWDPLIPKASYHIGEGVWTIVRPPGTLGYASYFATWLLFVIFLSLALRSMEKSALWRGAAMAAAMLGTGAMLLTGTRAAIVGLIAGTAVLLIVQWSRPGRRTVAGAVLSVIAIGAFYYAPPGQQLRSRMRWFVEDQWGGARRMLWVDSARMATYRLTTGYGPEVFTSEFPRFESVELAKAYPDFSHESPHNILLDALVSQGIPGLMFFVALCAIGLVQASRRRMAALSGALAAGIVSQQFTAFTIPGALMLFSTIALVIALGSPTPEPRPRVALSGTIGACASVAVSAALLFLAIRFATADHLLLLAKQRLDRGDLAGAAVQFERYDRWRSPGGSADLWYSRAVWHVASRSQNPLVRVKGSFESARAAKRATLTAEDPFNAWYNAAALSGSQGDPASVEPDLRAAIQAHPVWYKPHWALAQVLSIENRAEESRREARVALELNDGKDPEVARTLRKVAAQFTSEHSTSQR
jgi:O-antigen ligase